MVKIAGEPVIMASAKLEAGAKADSFTDNNRSPTDDIEPGSKPMQDSLAPIADAEEATRIISAEKELALEGLENPMNWSLSRKLRNHLILLFGTFMLTYCSSALTPSVGGIQQYYAVSREVALVPLALYVLGFGLGPFLMGPSSEVFGRRYIYVISYGSFAAWSWGAAYAPNIAALILFRFLAGVSGSSTLNNHPASIGDFTTVLQRQTYSASYAFMAFAGASIGPLVSGILVVYTNWHWNLILMAILVTVSWLLMVVGVEESFAPVLLQRKHKVHGRPVSDAFSLGRRYYNAIVTPFVLLVTEVPVAVISFYLSFLYAVFYAFFPVYPIVYVQIRGFSQVGLSLTYIAPTIGFAVAALTNCYATNWFLKRGMSRSSNGKIPPSAFYELVKWTGWTAPLGVFIIAFCSYTHVHWIADCIGAALFAFGTLVIFTGFIPFTVVLYQARAASALAAMTASRAVLASAFPLFSSTMYEKLGIPGASSLLAGVLVILLAVPWVFNHYSDRLWGKGASA